VGAEQAAAVNWTVEWNTESIENQILPGFNTWELQKIREGMCDAIEDFLAEMEYLQEFGEECEECGEFRLCNMHIGECLTPTDRGMKVECEEKLLCEECWERMQPREPDWDSVNDERHGR
jgi:hypothetical protein